MKKILFIGEMLIILAMLLGCSNQEDDYGLIKNKLVIDQISQIEIETDIYKKVITNQEDLDLLVSYMEEIQILDSSLEYMKSIEVDNIVRLKIFNKAGNIIESMSIAEKMIYYNHKWYPIGIQTYDKIEAFYKNADYKQLENSILLDIKHRRFSRKENEVAEAIQGTWLNENESKIKFDSTYLKQGDKYKYVFKYNIENKDDNNLDISIYGIKGLFIEGRKLSELYIEMDQTKTHMIMKTIMAGSQTHYDKLVYIDKDGLTLGSFDSYFFYENNWD